VTYYQFPVFISSEPGYQDTELTVRNVPPSRDYSAGSYPPASNAETLSHPLPPQTTHYWTSDRTRRLEYAAIDAASRGVRGWIRRHVVPDCFIPQEKQHLSFEDDRGSVVRYRLDLPDDGAEDEKEKKKPKTAKTKAKTKHSVSVAAEAEAEAETGTGTAPPAPAPPPPPAAGKRRGGLLFFLRRRR